MAVVEAALSVVAVVALAAAFVQSRRIAVSQMEIPIRGAAAAAEEEVRTRCHWCDNSFPRSVVTIVEVPLLCHRAPEEGMAWHHIVS